MYPCVRPNDAGTNPVESTCVPVRAQGLGNRASNSLASRCVEAAQGRKLHHPISVRVCMHVLCIRVCLLPGGPGSTEHIQVVASGRQHQLMVRAFAK
jgi:hypothetical protein